MTRRKGEIVGAGPALRIHNHCPVVLGSRRTIRPTYIPAARDRARNDGQWLVLPVKKLRIKKFCALSESMGIKQSRSGRISTTQLAHGRPFWDGVSSH
jgi:hypothetical protein